MKKLIMLLIALVLVIAPNGLDYNQVDAKGYKSGKKSFNSNTTTNQPDSTVNATTPNKSTTPVKNASASTIGKGGFMKGLLYGGLAGLLFGSLFANLGILGAMLGFLINLLAVVALVVLIRKTYNHFKHQRRKQDWNTWKS